MEISQMKPSREGLDKLIQTIDKQKNLDGLNMYEVAWEIYERTYYKYAINYQEERMLREKYEQKVVEKSTEIESLKEEIRELEARIGGENGTDGEGEKTPVS